MELSRSVGPAAASGSLSALIFAVGQEFLQDRAPRGFDLCPNLPQAPSVRIFNVELDLFSLLIGFVVGLVCWPILELFLLWRAYCKAWLSARLRGVTAPLYKILE